MPARTFCHLTINAYNAERLERCRSGQTALIRNQWGAQVPRGFKSLSLRHKKTADRRFFYGGERGKQKPRKFFASSFSEIRRCLSFCARLHQAVNSLIFHDILLRPLGCKKHVVSFSESPVLFLKFKGFGQFVIRLFRNNELFYKLTRQVRIF